MNFVLILCIHSNFPTLDQRHATPDFCLSVYIMAENITASVVKSVLERDWPIKWCKPSWTTQHRLPISTWRYTLLDVILARLLTPVLWRILLSQVLWEWNYKVMEYFLSISSIFDGKFQFQHDATLNWISCYRLLPLYTKLSRLWWHTIELFQNLWLNFC